MEEFYNFNPTKCPVKKNEIPTPSGNPIDFTQCRNPNEYCCNKNDPRSCCNNTINPNNPDYILETNLDNCLHNICADNRDIQDSKGLINDTCPIKVINKNNDNNSKKSIPLNNCKPYILADCGVNQTYGNTQVKDIGDDEIVKEYSNNLLTPCNNICLKCKHLNGPKMGCLSCHTKIKNLKKAYLSASGDEKKKIGLSLHNLCKSILRCQKTNKHYKNFMNNYKIDLCNKESNRCEISRGFFPNDPNNPSNSNTSNNADSNNNTFSTCIDYEGISNRKSSIPVKQYHNDITKCSQIPAFVNKPGQNFNICPNYYESDESNNAIPCHLSATNCIASDQVKIKRKYDIKNQDSIEGINDCSFLQNFIYNGKRGVIDSSGKINNPYTDQQKSLDFNLRNEATKEETCTSPCYLYYGGPTIDSDSWKLQSPYSNHVWFNIEDKNYCTREGMFWDPLCESIKTENECNKWNPTSTSIEDYYPYQRCKWDNNKCQNCDLDDKTGSCQISTKRSNGTMNKSNQNMYNIYPIHTMCNDDKICNFGMTECRNQKYMCSTEKRCIYKNPMCQKCNNSNDCNYSNIDKNDTWICKNNQCIPKNKPNYICSVDNT